MLINKLNREEHKAEKDKLVSLLLMIYIVLIGAVFPLAINDGYFDILTFKYYFYCISTIAIFSFVMLRFFVVKIKCFKNISLLRTFKYYINKMTAPDVFLLLFYIIVIISTLTSDYVYESFWGNEGRLTGMFLISLYIISYMLISKLCVYKKWYIDIIIISGTLVAILGIADYFNLDILHLKETIAPSQKAIFTSTLGNINTFTAYVGIIIALTTVSFTLEKNFKRSIFYFICMIINFFAIIMGVSDNAYLSIGALFAFLPLYLFNDRQAIKRYLLVFATFFTVMQCIDWINIIFADRVVGIESAFGILIRFSNLHYIVLLIWIIVIACWFLDYKTTNRTTFNGIILRNIWIGVLTVVFLCLIFLFYDCNIAGHAERYKIISNYILFNDDWGTNRGYIWRNAIESFENLPVWKKIVGYGPETLGIILLQKTSNNPYNQMFDSAHNEYLHLLLTTGILGIGFYLLFLITYIRSCFVGGKLNTFKIIIVFAVICYSVQAFVNINVPVISPVLWLLLGIGGIRPLKEINGCDEKLKQN